MTRSGGQIITNPKQPHATWTENTHSRRVGNNPKIQPFHSHTSAHTHTNPGIRTSAKLADKVHPGEKN